jgi:hypothetical protein
LRTLFALACIATVTVACYEYRGSHSRTVRCSPVDGPSDPGPGECPDLDCPGGADVIYLSGDPLTCAAIDFTCPSGTMAFESACGCGCAPIGGGSGTDTSSTCPQGDDVLLLSDEPKVCEGVEFTCPDGQERFDRPCGCGCYDLCPDPSDPNVHVLSDDPEICALIDFTCPDSCAPYDNRCGCGCIEPGASVGCPDPEDPDVLYVSTAADVCDRVTVTCGADETAFDDACGCGCLR